MNPAEKAQALFDGAAKHYAHDDIFALFHIGPTLYGGNVGVPKYHDIQCGITPLPFTPQHQASEVVKEYLRKRRELPLFVSDVKTAKMIGEGEPFDTQCSRMTTVQEQLIEIYINEHLYPNDAERIGDGICALLRGGEKTHDLPDSMVLLGEDPMMELNYLVGATRNEIGFDLGALQLMRREAGAYDMLLQCADTKLPILCRENDLEFLAGEWPTHVTKFYALIGKPDCFAEAYLVPE